MTTVTPERRAAAAIPQLTGQVQGNAISILLPILISEAGIASLLKEFDGKSGVDSTALLHNNISAFSDYTWDRRITVDEFVLGFHYELDKISKLDLIEELNGHLLLKQSSHNAHGFNMVVGSASGLYSLQATDTNFHNDSRPERLPSSSMPTKLLSAQTTVALMSPINRNTQESAAEH